MRGKWGEFVKGCEWYLGECMWVKLTNRVGI